MHHTEPARLIPVSEPQAAQAFLPWYPTLLLTRCPASSLLSSAAFSCAALFQTFVQIREDRKAPAQPAGAPLPCVPRDHKIRGTFCCFEISIFSAVSVISAVLLLLFSLLFLLSTASAAYPFCRRCSCKQYLSSFGTVLAECRRLY